MLQRPTGNPWLLGIPSWKGAGEEGKTAISSQPFLHEDLYVFLYTSERKCNWIVSTMPSGGESFISQCLVQVDIIDEWKWQNHINVETEQTRLIGNTFLLHSPWILKEGFVEPCSVVDTAVSILKKLQIEISSKSRRTYWLCHRGDGTSIWFKCNVHEPNWSCSCYLVSGRSANCLMVEIEAFLLYSTAFQCSEWRSYGWWEINNAQWDPFVKVYWAEIISQIEKWNIKGINVITS